MKRNIYFDHNATTAVLPQVEEAMAPFWREFYANPSSLHEAGSRVARKIREARQTLAQFLDAQDEAEIIFTSGGTESNHTALRSALFTEKKKRRIVTTAVEHSSILKFTQALEEEGIETIATPVDQKGNLNRERLYETITPETAVVSVMMANNETGVIFPVEEIGRELRKKRILFHIDAVQAIGKIPFSLKEIPIDFLSLSAHKFGGPKGIGVLYVKKGTPFHPLFVGGTQERGRRAGTENVAAIIGLGEACRVLRKVLFQENERIRQLRDDFETKVLRAIPKVEVNGDRGHRLPNTSNLAFEGVDAEALLILLDEEGVSASSGSACLSGSPEPSPVLKAMGYSDEKAKGSVRFSFGLQNTASEVDEVVRLLEPLVNRLREIEFKEQHPHSVV